MGKEGLGEAPEWLITYHNEAIAAILDFETWKVEDIDPSQCYTAKCEIGFLRITSLQEYLGRTNLLQLSAKLASALSHSLRMFWTHRPILDSAFIPYSHVVYCRDFRTWTDIRFPGSRILSLEPERTTWNQAARRQSEAASMDASLKGTSVNLEIIT